MNFDDILAHLGNFGVYQKLIVITITLINIPAAFHQFGQVFFAANVDFWCTSSDQVVYCSTAWNLTKSQCDEAIQSFLALIKDDNCNKYTNLTLQSFINNDQPTDDWLSVRCDNWAYDTSQYKSTILQEWDLVCDDKTKPAIAQSVFFTGVLVGSFLFGVLSDRIGRKASFFIAAALLGASGLAVSFSPSYIVYTCLRFVVAVANVGFFMQSYIIVTEWVGPSHRKLVLFIGATLWSVGYMVLALLAYFIPRWRTLSIVISLSGLTFLALIPFIPESARWLIMQGRLEEAKKTIQTAARVNKVTLPAQLFDEEHLLKNTSAHGQGTVADLYITKLMRRKTLIMMYIWFVNSCVYYGLSLSTSGFGVNDYVAFMISGAIEIPANILLLLIVDYFGRRPCLCCSMVIGGLSCIFAFFMPAGIWRILTALCGKFSITFSFSLAYLFSAEIFPTPVRSTGLGVSSTSARVGSMLSPFILLIKQVWEPFPFIVFGCLSILAGLLGLLLPETNGKQLPETLEEGEHFGRVEMMNRPGVQGEAKEMDGPTAELESTGDGLSLPPT